MKVIEIIEQEDGSAIANVEITKEEKQFLLEYALNNILKELIDFESKEKFNSEAYSECDLMNLEEVDESHFNDNTIKEDVTVHESIDNIDILTRSDVIDDEEDYFAGETDL